ncbi:MAG: methyltransferase [Thermodesulfobacteriota bacterium]
MPPGPVPPGAGDAGAVPGPGETLDCLSGHWRIFQLRSGHRYSTDDLLTAWYAARAVLRGHKPPQAGLDLGCGVGSVGLLLLWRFPGLRLVGVEAQEESAALARRSLRYNGVQDRAEVRQGDLRCPGILGPGERFELVTGSPPYLAPGEGRRSSAAQRGPCRFEDRGGVRDYLRVAEGHLAADGLVVWVHATRYRETSLEAARAAGLSRLRYRPVAFREGRESLITLFCAARGAGASTVEEAPLVVRTASGDYSADYAAVRREMGFPA